MSNKMVKCSDVIAELSVRLSHMVCIECGKVFEFYDSAIEERQRMVAGKAGFVMEEHSLYIYGMCQGMKKNGACSKK